uniref:non-ribosomal peptide synthetase n=1 Tax=Pseudomonas sp. MWU13-2105 TaxID=2935074 RepID=UPI0020102DDB
SADVRVLFGQPSLSALAAAVGGSTEIVVPANLIPEHCEHITPDLLPLISLTQAQIDRVVATVPGGAANIQDIYPLAPLQEGILYHHLATEQGDPYVQQALFYLEDRARLLAFVDAFEGVIDRHDILRTAVLWEGLDEPLQVVLRRAPMVLEELTFATADGDIDSQLRGHFDPLRYRLDVRQAPLLRLACAYDAAQQRWVALLLFHHMALDHTALDVVRHEMQAYLLGQQAQLGAAVPYRNYVAQARLGVSQASHEAFFREMLGDIDESTLPFGLDDVQGDGSAIDQAHLVVDEALSLRLRQCARQLGVSAASLHHLAWAQVVGGLSGRQSVVFGTVLMGRMQGGEGADRALGMFINTLPLRIEVGAQGARAGVRATHARLSALLGHEHASLALAQRCSGVAAPAPLFSALLNYRHSGGQLDNEALAAWNGIESLGGDEWTNYPLSLSIDDLGEAFVLTAQVLADIGAQRICGYMHAALDSLVEALERTPEMPLHDLSILPLAERRQLLLDFNRTARDYPHGQLLHRLFEAQAAARPQAVAARQGELTVTYGELNARANALAHYLREQGVMPGTRVAILLERSVDLLVSLLATLKCGAAYLSLDRLAPEERLRFMLEDSAAVVLLTHSDQAVAEGMPRVNLDTLVLAASALNQAPVVPDDSAMEQTPACIIYTSGSTGQPKGVMVTHNGIARLVIDNGYYVFSAQDRIAFASNPAFDASSQEVWGALLNGAESVIVDHRTLLEPLLFAEQLERCEVTVLIMATALFNLYAGLIPKALARLRLVMCGGERADPASFRRVRECSPQVRLINGYGPTEATTCASAYTVSEVLPDTLSLPIGQPNANVRIYVLNARREPVPVGVVGEMYIGGAGVALGYLNRPDLTAERFSDDPFAEHPGGRLYRSGDLARWLPDGNLEYLARNDGQVKIRGFRVELGEIETCLHHCAGVRNAVVLAREDSPGDKYLVAYYTVQPDGEVAEPEALRAQLAADLPEYMVPGLCIRLDALPLTLNGKVDVRALPAPEAEQFARRAFEAPHGDLESRLAQVWAEVLDLERVGRHDNFFALGGHSLLAVRLVSQLSTAGLTLSLAELFQHASVAALAELLESRTAEVRSDGPLVPVRTTGSQRPLFLVHEFTGLDLYFPTLGQHIDSDIPIYGLPGVALGQPQLQTMECLATRLLGLMRTVQPQGPYRLAGWSFGGVLAYEIAIQLVGLDEEVEFVGLIDTYLPRLVDQGRARWSPDSAHKLHLLEHCERFWTGHAEGADTLALLEGLRAELPSFDFEDLLQRSREQGVLPAEFDVLGAGDVWRYLDREVAHGHAQAHYTVYANSVPVHLFTASERAHDAPAHSGYLGWDEVLPLSQLHSIKVPGDHQSLMQAPHIQGLGQAINTALAGLAGRPLPSRSVHQPLLTIQGGRGDHTPLFCVPGAGDSVTGFIGLTDAFGPHWPIHGLQPRGLDGRTVPYSLVETAAEAYLQAIDSVQPNGPVHLLGHSFGGWVVFEMAQRLTARGREVASLTLIDSESPGGNGVVGKPYTAMGVLERLIETMQLAAGKSMEVDRAAFEAQDDAGQMRLLHAGMVRAGLLPQRSATDSMRGPARAFGTALRTRYQPSAIYTGPVRLVLADDPVLDAAGNQREQQSMVAGWRRCAPDLTVWRGPGNHFTILKAPHVQHLASWWRSHQ